MKRFISIGIVFLCVIQLLQPLPVFGMETQVNIEDNENVIFENFNFSVSDTCSSHECFYQVSAIDDGSFLLVSRYTNIKANRDLVYKLCYIDIYSPDGLFLTELSFYTDQDFVAELTDCSVEMYFYDRIITYNLDSQELHARLIQPGESIESGIYEKLQQTSFSIGEWNYLCKKGFHGLIQLIRTHKNGNELVLSFPGTGFSEWNTLIPALTFGAALFLLYCFIKKKRQQG